MMSIFCNRMFGWTPSPPLSVALWHFQCRNLLYVNHRHTLSGPVFPGLLYPLNLTFVYTTTRLFWAEALMSTLDSCMMQTQVEIDDDIPSSKKYTHILNISTGAWVLLEPGIVGEPVWMAHHCFSFICSDWWSLSFNFGLAPWWLSVTIGRSDIANFRSSLQPSWSPLNLLFFFWWSYFTVIDTKVAIFLI